MEEGIATPLQSAREAKGLSRAALAVALEVGEHQVRRWETGEKLIPSKHLEVLTDLLGVTADHLLGLDREPVTTSAEAA
jgi:ribosome-binding protein aMBF1 (putative translation factor)